MAERPIPHILGMFTTLILLFLLAPFEALAADIAIVPSISLGAGYDDNLFFEKSNPTGDAFAKINPEVSITYGTELLRIALNAAVDLWEYLDQRDLSREFHRYTLSGDYLLGERMSINGILGYYIDDILESELAETGLLVRSVGNRRRQSAGGGFSYGVSEVSNLSVNYQFQDTDYDSERNVDYTSHYLSLGYQWGFRDFLSTLTLRPSYSRYDSDVSTVDNYELSLGYSHSFSELLRLSAFLGGRYTITDSRILAPVVVFDPSLLPFFPFRTVFNALEFTEKDWAPVANIRVTREDETSNVTLGFDLGITYSAQGEPIERERLFLSSHKKWGSRLSSGFVLGISRTSFQIPERNILYLSANVNVSYRFTEHQSLRMEYTFDRNQDDSLLGDSDGFRNRIWVAYTFEYPIRW